MPLTKEAFKKLRQIQIRTNRNVNDLFGGAYRSAFKGKGLEFEEVREYQIGDDIRSIDWNVTARLQHPYIKVFKEERELTMMLVVDISASARYSHTLHLKSELIADIGALLAFSAIKNQDNVGLILFSDHVELFLKPKKGLKHVLRVIREILFFKSKGNGTNIANALAFLGNVQKRSVTCFLISDFITSPIDHALKLTAKHHELIAVQIYDEFEKSFPPLGIIEMKDLETGVISIVDSSNKSQLENYQAKASLCYQNLEHLLNKIGADFISISTDGSYLESLRLFFKRKGARH